ncbi:MAG: POTRA domain-containing protein, partial [Cyclobacteriaceae bacterium]
MARANYIPIFPIFIGLFCGWLGVSAQSPTLADSSTSRTLQLVNPFPIDSAQAQLVKIDKIFLLGNKKTKDHIILRELNVKVGDLINRSDLDLTLERDREKIINTRLFLDAKISVISLSERVVDIVVQVSERWYIFPIPIFQLADRNFNEWWVNQNRDLSRVNYGMKFYHRNFRGRGERLKLTAQFGFTKVFGMSYS